MAEQHWHAARDVPGLSAWNSSIMRPDRPSTCRVHRSGRGSLVSTPWTCLNRYRRACDWTVCCEPNLGGNLPSVGRNECHALQPADPKLLLTMHVLQADVDHDFISPVGFSSSYYWDRASAEGIQEKLTAHALSQMRAVPGLRWPPPHICARSTWP